MAVQAQHAFCGHDHDPRAISIRPTMLLDDATTGASSSVFLGDAHLLRGDTALISDLILTCKDTNDASGCFVPRKRARVAANDDAGACSLTMDGHALGGALLPPVPVPGGVPQAFTAAVQSQSREHGSGAASTSGRPPPAASQGLLSQLHRHGVEIDAVVRIESERLRAGLQNARRRHARAVVSALERAAARRLRAAEADLARALARAAELEERLRQTIAEGQAWQGVASGHEAAAAGLRSTLDQLLQPPPLPCAQADEAADAQSCCFENDRRRAYDDRDAARRACRACGAAGACVLLLPCRHLCLCARCEPAVDACPVCAATKNASLHVLLA